MKESKRISGGYTIFKFKIVNTATYAARQFLDVNGPLWLLIPVKFDVKIIET